ncbi:BMP family ABC transporter substrate-binding protein [Mycoplasma struthionis]|uniref:BMP family ABC transporter substrate-binding protein n=1 Tax=Mycoplasma struthionis TaxID=538220 RepID=A0A3G8LGB0_9MOLU|nr:BMP family ABC transporter substrate-binding protein [Mycoplasma struthionis]AZG68494.1 BMP family ABC transporter substrate-binding protein [Mycoplasma struthionis]
MKKSTKLFLSIGAGLTAMAGIPLVAASCGGGKRAVSATGYTHPKSPKTTVVNINTDDKFKLTPEQAKSVKKIAVITDAGDYNDKSFNQSAWEAILTFANKQNPDIPRDKYDIYEVKEGKFTDAYNLALNSGAQVFVLPGFLHADNIKTWYQANKAKIQEKKITLIGLDFDNGPFGANIPDTDGTGIFLNMKIKEAAFIAGYAAAKFLSEKPEAKRTFTTFGGGAFPGVTDFNEGFMKGVLYFNSQPGNEDKKVRTSEPEVNLTSGFTVGQQMNGVIEGRLATNPSLILPVAGPATDVTVNSPNLGDALVVGVDTDQALSVSKNSDRFFTSIQKNIGQAFYDAVARVATGIGMNDEILGGFKYGSKTVNLVNGVDKNWVAVSPSHLLGEDKVKADKYLAEGKAEFEKLEKNETLYRWLSSGRVTMGADAAEVNPVGQRLNQLATEINKRS